jgi:hypothetical protein
LLAWHERGGIHHRPAQLLNISRSGALVRSDALPREGRDAWLRLEEPAATAWVKATVVRHAGDREIGLAFIEQFPEGFLLAPQPG